MSRAQTGGFGLSCATGATLTSGSSRTAQGAVSDPSEPGYCTYGCVRLSPAHDFGLVRRRETARPHDLAEIASLRSDVSADPPLAILLLTVNLSAIALTTTVNNMIGPVFS